MQFRLVTLIAGAFTAAVLTGCGGAGPGASGAPGTAQGTAALPAVSGREGAASTLGFTTRRAASEPTCGASGSDNFVGGGFGNVAAGGYAVVAGGSQNDACAQDSTVTGGQTSGIDGASVGATIAGGINHVITKSSGGAIAGGGNNSLSSSYSGTIAGGLQNSVTSAVYGTIGGGENNAVTGQYGTISGGFNNQVSGSGYGFVGGGQSNAVRSAWGAVGGGYGNQAAELATVPGGKDNIANGLANFAAGFGSTAGYAGDFVWSDVASGATALKGTAANQFLARASGGVTFYSSANLKAGVRLAPGSGTWSSLSDRNAKSAIVPVSDDDILAKVSALPISEWSYTTERGVRHVGPMAQDFYAAFNVGEDDRHITSIDEDGVALAAIKALNARVERRDAALDAKLAEKDARIDALQRQMAKFAVEVGALRDSRR